jgi:hypothetical protein
MVKAAGISGIKRWNIRKTELMSLQLIVRTRTLRYLYKGKNEFQRDYQPRSNLLKDENGDLLAYSHNILNRWKSSFSPLLRYRYDR